MKRSRISPVSKKRAERLKVYYKLREAFLIENPKCMIYPELNACDIHHIAGRHGEMLSKVEYWMAVSRKAHDEIHRNGTWARENGYLVNILSSEL